VGAGGHVILSGLLTPQAEAVIAAYETAGFTLQARRIIGDWTTLTLVR
jgi:ribosomal protein L11 methyltransferase